MRSGEIPINGFQRLDSVKVKTRETEKERERERERERRN